MNFYFVESGVIRQARDVATWPALGWYFGIGPREP